MKLTKQQRLENLHFTAVNAVSYVGRANYSERITAACKAIEKSMETGRRIYPIECESDD